MPAILVFLEYKIRLSFLFFVLLLVLHYTLLDAVAM